MENKKIFSDVKFYVIGTIKPQILGQLESGGATKRKFLVDQITHVICGEDFDEHEAFEASDLYDLPLVQQEWVSRSVSLGRLANTKACDPIAANKFFRNLNFSISGLGPNDCKTLYALVSFYGGKVDKNITTNTTHLVCGAADGLAYNSLKNNTRLIIVTPDYVVDCVKSTSIVDPAAYHPRLLKKPATSETATAVDKERQQLQKTEAREEVKDVVGNITKGAQSIQSQQSGPSNLGIRQQSFGQYQNQISQLTTGAKIQIQQVTRPSVPSVGQGINDQQKVVDEGQAKSQITQQPLTTSIPITASAVPPTVSQAPQQVKVEPPSEQQQLSGSGVMSMQNVQPVQRITTMPTMPRPMMGNQQFQLIQGNQQATAGGNIKTGTMVLQSSNNMHQLQMQGNVQPHQQGGNYQTGTSIQVKPAQHHIQTQQHMHKQVILSPMHQQQQQQQQQQSLGGNQTAQNIVIINQNQMNQGQAMQSQGQPGGTIIIQQQQPQQQQQQITTVVRQPENNPLQQSLQSQIINAPQGRLIHKPTTLMQQQTVGPNQFKQVIQQQQQQLQGGSTHLVINQNQQQKLVLHTQQPGGQPVDVVHQGHLQQTQQQPGQQQLVVHHQTGTMPDQIQSGVQPQIIVGQHQQQQTNQQQSNAAQPPQQHINIIQGQGGIIQQQPQPTGQQGQQWSPQTIKMGPNQQLVQGPYIRTAQRQLIHLDAQTHAHLQSMDPIKKAEYLSKLQNKQRNIMFRQQMFSGRPGAPSSIVTTSRIGGGQQHIVIRGQVPSGLTHQQQLQWIQQQRPQVLVRSNTSPALTSIPQQVPSTQVSGLKPQQQQQQQPQQQHQQNPQFNMDPNLVQQSGPNRPPIQRIASIPGTKIMQPQTPGCIQTRFVTVDRNVMGQEGTPILNAGQLQMAGDNSGSTISKTKTALAHMLNSRLNNGNVVASMPDGTVEPSAAGTLRLMTAQHNAALNPTVNLPQELIALQQRRPLNNQMTNQQIIKTEPLVGQAPLISGGGQTNQQVSYNPIRGPQIQRPQFYGHNPNLKLPIELFLIGCNFFIVEYDETNRNELPQWKELIQKHGGVIETFYCPRVTHVLGKSQRHGVVMQAIRDGKRCVTAYWLNDIILKKQVTPPWQALHLPTPSTFGVQKPAARHIIAISGFEADERQRIKKMVVDSGAKLTTYFSKQNTVLVTRRLDGAKYKKAKEWNIPVLNATWLSDILLGNLSTMTNYDTAKYQQYNLNCPFRIEYTLVAHLMTAWKSPINLTQEAHERLKRSHTEQPGTEPKPKIARTLPPLEQVPMDISVKRMPEQDQAPRVLFSQVDNLDGLTKAVTALGGIVVAEPEQATHLVMTRLMRTCKLLACLCTVRYALSSNWVIESAKAGQFVPESEHPLRSKEFEEFKCDIKKVLHSPMRRTLFVGKTFFLTPSVRPVIKEMVQLIELSGGTVEKSRRSAAKIQETNSQSPDSYIILTCANDLHLLNDLTRSNKVNRIINKASLWQICTTELVMKSIMSQSIDFDAHAIKYL